MTVAGERPDPDEMVAPWVTVDCDCRGFLHDCDSCDGDGWHFFNPDTGAKLSDLMRDALERHG